MSKVKFVCPKCGEKVIEKAGPFDRQSQIRISAYLMGSQKKKCPKCGADMEVA